MDGKPIIIAMLISNSDFGCWFNLNGISQQSPFSRADNVLVRLRVHADTWHINLGWCKHP